MNKKNQRVVAYTPWSDTEWSITGDVHGRSSGFDSDHEVLKSLYQCLSGFISPTEVEFVVQYPEEEGLEPEAGRIYKNEITFQIVIDELSERIGNSNNARIARISIEDCEARFQIESGMVWIGTESTAYASFDKQGQQIASPSRPPLTVELFNTGLVGEEYEYEIVLRSHTDIWFENTSLGEINRRQLRNLILCLGTPFENAHIKFDSSYYSEDGLRERGLGELIFCDEYI
jgi:hypothetical protein